MVSNNVVRMDSKARPVSAAPNVLSRMAAAVSQRVARMWCATHGHMTLLHFEPNKLSLQCALCGYESEGWEVGRRPQMAARRRVENHVPAHQVRSDNRRGLRALPSGARMAS